MAYPVLMPSESAICRLIGDPNVAVGDQLAILSFPRSLCHALSPFRRTGRCLATASVNFASGLPPRRILVRAQ